MKTLVHHDGALGDLLLSVPCLHAIRAEAGPFHLVGRGDVVRFLKRMGVADEASSSDRALFSTFYSTPDQRLHSFLSEFDRAYIFTTDEGASPFGANRSIIPRTHLIRTAPSRGCAIHAAVYRLSQLEPGTAAACCASILNVPIPEIDAVRSVLAGAGHRPGTPVLGLHPGSGGMAKCWPLERYFELVRRLQANFGIFVVLFTGEAERGGIEESVSRYVSQRKNVLHWADRDLLSAAALLRHCGSYIGNDSGFSHLAGLLGCSAIVLFGPTDPAIWKPLGRRVQVVSTADRGPLSGIGVDEVVLRVQGAIGQL